MAVSDPLKREQIAEINPAAIGEMLGRHLIESHELLRASLEERDGFILNMQHAAKLDQEAAVASATSKAFEEAAEIAEKHEACNAPSARCACEIKKELRKRAGEAKR